MEEVHPEKSVPSIKSSVWTKQQNDFRRIHLQPHFRRQRSYVTTVEDMNISNSRKNEDQSEQLNVPGLTKAFDKKLPASNRLFWFVIFSSCAGFCLYQLIDRFVAYYTLRTTLDVFVQRNQTIIFPSVTICPSNGASLPCLKELLRTKINSVCDKNALAKPCQYRHAEELHTTTVKFSDLGTTHKEVNDHCFTMAKHLVEAQVPCEQFGAAECFIPFDADFTNITTYWGNCLIMTPQRPLEYRGPYTYVRITINTNGAMFLLHTKGVEQRQDAYFLAEPLNEKRFSNIRIGTKQYNFLNTTRDPCLQEIDYVNCRNKCGDERLDTLLNCSVAFMINSKLQPCNSPLEAFDQFVAAQKFYAEMKSGDCYCTRKCTETVYSVTTDVVSELKDGLTRFHLYYPDNLHEIVSESFSYTFPALLSDVGGSLGFYLGFCVVTLVEIVELVFKKTLKCMRGLFNKS